MPFLKGLLEIEAQERRLVSRSVSRLVHPRCSEGRLNAERNPSLGHPLWSAISSWKTGHHDDPPMLEKQ